MTTEARQLMNILKKRRKVKRGWKQISGDFQVRSSHSLIELRDSYFLSRRYKKLLILNNLKDERTVYGYYKNIKCFFHSVFKNIMNKE